MLVKLASARRAGKSKPLPLNPADTAVTAATAVTAENCYRAIELILLLPANTANTAMPANVSPFYLLPSTFYHYIPFFNLRLTLKQVFRFDLV